MDESFQRVRNTQAGAPCLSAYQYAPEYLLYRMDTWDMVPQTAWESRSASMSRRNYAMAGTSSARTAAAPSGARDRRNWPTIRHNGLRTTGKLSVSGPPMLLNAHVFRMSDYPPLADDKT